MQHSQIAYQTKQLFEKKFFDSMASLEIYKMTAMWPCDSLTFTFFTHSKTTHQTGQLFVKEFFDSIYSLESEKMTALWPNDSLTFTFYIPVVPKKALPQITFLFTKL